MRHGPYWRAWDASPGDLLIVLDGRTSQPILTVNPRVSEHAADQAHAHIAAVRIGKSDFDLTLHRVVVVAAAHDVEPELSKPFLDPLRGQGREPGQRRGWSDGPEIEVGDHG